MSYRAVREHGRCYPIRLMCRALADPLHYAAKPYQPMLTTHGITASMSRKGNCWDNACVESFFGTVKRELVYHRQYATRS